MKLLYCPSCQDIKRLSRARRFCKCAASWAILADGYRIGRYGGKGVPLGITNQSFSTAVDERPETGLGSRFEAFVIPRDCLTVEYEQ